MHRLFTFTGARKISFGIGSFDHLGDYLGELNAKRPLVVMDPAPASSGLLDKIRELLAGRGIKFIFFEKVVSEPPVELADDGAKVAVKSKCDAVIGIGGGSAMDLAKAIAVLAGNKGKAAYYLGLNKVPGPGLPKIMVPTTAGTGSEVTSTAVFVRKTLTRKESMESPYLYPDMAVLDPLLTLTLPPEFTASTGISALCQAIESYTSRSASPMTEMISLEAVTLISESLRTCVHDGRNIAAREQMLLGSLYAGLGMANAGVTAAHALSYPLGGQYGIPHSLANTILLPHVMAYNLPGAQQKYADIALAMGEVIDGIPVRAAAELAVEAVDHLIEDCGAYATLEDLEIHEDAFEALAKSALSENRLLSNNPRKVTEEDAIEIYRAAY
ncbi:MAG: alcohol dehydrogenase [Syntrophus sp. SKADARSKE-3]|nr:alcohol dehydrogenase [Syntrophus sp. SKADARSKE-3]